MVSCILQLSGLQHETEAGLVMVHVHQYVSQLVIVAIVGETDSEMVQPGAVCFLLVKHALEIKYCHLEIPKIITGV